MLSGWQGCGGITSAAVGGCGLLKEPRLARLAGEQDEGVKFCLIISQLRPNE